MITKSSLFASTLKLASWVLLATLFTSIPAQAQVSLSPMIIDLQANRGQSQASINISNSSDKPFRARVYAQPFTYDRDTGFKTLTSSPNDLNPYLQFSPRELVIPAGVTRRVRLITRFPANLPDGEYRSIIFTEKLDETKDGNGNKINIVTRIGATVYVHQGNLSPNIVVDNARWNQKQQQIQLLVKNTGKASARAAVKWTLQQGNKVIKQGNVDPNFIIAESDRYIPLNRPQPKETALAAGEYQLSGELVWGDKNQNKQKFTVKLTIPANVN
ncbi:fimbrial biogenesis chaperone [Nostoc sp.]|uniref:fimbrial biogenesis chaperone n=1 Tax=Nostoc sp. TaxID=1180 RepID=UPI002FFC24D6